MSTTPSRLASLSRLPQQMLAAVCVAALALVICAGLVVAVLVALARTATHAVRVLAGRRRSSATDAQARP